MGLIGSFPSGPLLGGRGERMKFRGTLPGTEPSLSDWDWVRKQIAEDAPVPYDASDPDDGPYDPNDDAAVEAYWSQATIWSGWPNPVLIQKDGVPVFPDGTPRTETPKLVDTETTVDDAAAKAS
jgi:hypothetical protein